MPRSALLLRILTRRIDPSGATANPSVNVPPVSIQICQGVIKRVDQGKIPSSM